MPTTEVNGPLSLHAQASETAPDGSVVKPLLRTELASQCHCTLAAGATSWPVAHYDIAELWYCLAGEGQFYCEGTNQDQPFAIAAGASWHIPPRKVFQFRNSGAQPLMFLITTTPPWPGSQAANTRVTGYWADTVSARP